MLQLVFTLDYEIHGNGDGCPLELMVEPTDRMLDLFDCYGAKLTIMAEVAEILRFREHAVTTGRDQFGYEAIVGQLRRAVASAHDVQLHLHPSYCRAVYRDGRWQQDYASYDLARLGHDRLVKLIGVGKAYLEDTLRGARSHYTCSVFRAGHWSMHPSRDVVEALATDGIRIDTSVFKWGRRDSLVKFDYGAAWHRFVPWPIDVADVCKPDPMGSVFEVPICAEHRPWWAFVTLYRLHRMLQSRVHRLGVGYSGNKTNSIALQEAAGALTHGQAGFPDAIAAVVFDPANQYLATAGGSEVKLWKVTAWPDRIGYEDTMAPRMPCAARSETTEAPRAPYRLFSTVTPISSLARTCETFGWC